MKVCHVTTVHDKNDSRIVNNECIALKEAGYDVCILVAGYKNGEIRGIPVFGLKKWKNRIIHFFFTSIFGVFKKARKINADVYHFHDPELMIFGILVKIWGKRIIYDVHENNPAAILSKPYLKSRLLKKTLSLIISLTERFLARYFEFVITARPDISDYFKGTKTVTVRNFPIFRDYDLIPTINIKKEKFVVIYVGVISKIRGIIELINAFKGIDEAEIWLLGPFESEALQEECEKLDGWGNARYLGVVEPHEIFSYIKLADVGIITYLPVPNHITTLATKPFEYMMCKLPVIMSNFIYWKDFFKDSAVYVNPSDSLDIANKVRYLMENKILAIEMGEKNYRLIRNKYNWQLEKKKLLEVYDKLSD